MTEAPLTEDELLVLAGLARLLVRADGFVTAEEAVALENVSEALIRTVVFGGGAYRTQAVAVPVGDRGAIFELLKRAAVALPDEDAVKRAALGVTRPEARGVIQRALGDIAMADGLTASEKPLLEWLEDAWPDG